MKYAQKLLVFGVCAFVVVVIMGCRGDTQQETQLLRFKVFEANMKIHGLRGVSIKQSGWQEAPTGYAVDDDTRICFFASASGTSRYSPYSFATVDCAKVLKSTDTR